MFLVWRTRKWFLVNNFTLWNMYRKCRESAWSSSIVFAIKRINFTIRRGRVIYLGAYLNDFSIEWWKKPLGGGPHCILRTDISRKTKISMYTSVAISFFIGTHQLFYIYIASTSEFRRICFSFVWLPLLCLCEKLDAKTLPYY